MLAIKLTVTPLLMLAVSLIAKRWGSFIGGLVSGLPLTSAPISIYMAIEQGTCFAQHAAHGSLAGLTAIMLTYLNYVILTIRYSSITSCTICIFVFCLSSELLIKIESSLFINIITVLIVLILYLYTETPPQSRTDQPVPSLNLPARLLTATGMVLLITGLADMLGPEISGVLSPVPVIAWPLTVFTHLHGGRRDALAIIRGNATSAISVLVFYVIVEYYIAALSPLLTFFVAMVVSVLATSIVFVALHRGNSPMR